MTDSKSKDRIAFVLVPGSFSPPGYYKGVYHKLAKDGFENVQECRLLSACPANDQLKPPAKLHDDALYIREVIQAFLSKGKDVVLVMNSYAGFPGTEAIKGLPHRKSLSPAGAESGAVVGMVYLSSFLPHAGDSLRSMMGDALFEPLKSGSPGEYMIMPDGSDQGIFNDWYAEGKEAEAKAAAADIITHSSDSFDGKVTNDMWSKAENFQGKVVYIVGAMDVIVPPSLAESMIGKVNAITPNRIQTIEIKNGGHVTHVTKPDVVAGFLENVVVEIESGSAV